MGKIVLTLTEEDLMELQGILVDADGRGALEFLQARIAPRLPRKGANLCDSSRLNPYLLKPKAEKR